MTTTAPHTQLDLFGRESSTPPNACPMCGCVTGNRFGGLFSATCWKRLDHPATAHQLQLALRRQGIATTTARLQHLTRQQRGDLFAWLFGPHPRPAWLRQIPEGTDDR